ncbi:MAG: trehalose 6-phosphate synthase [bacterium]
MAIIKKTEIKTLKQFYELVRATVPLRREIVNLYIKGKEVPGEYTNSLKQVMASLAAVSGTSRKAELFSRGDSRISVDISYEYNELEKDIFFLSHGEEKFCGYLQALHPAFSEAVGNIADALRGVNFNLFASDRDGTVNNYCGRYNSSIQSVYNAVFLTRFAQKRTVNSVILTSASLADVGLMDMSVAPAGSFIYAGSKGREFCDRTGRRSALKIDDEKQAKLNELNSALSELVSKKDYEIFPLIGSGLQFKFGQTTIARQDISGSVTDEISLEFMDIVKGLVNKADPEGNFFRIEDTGRDVEIILTFKGTGKDFDKGDGLNLIDSELGLGMENGRGLICGDTASDVAMLEVAVEKNPDTESVFVTIDEELKKRVKGINAGALFADKPDVLVTALNELSKGE